MIDISLGLNEMHVYFIMMKLYSIKFGDDIISAYAMYVVIMPFRMPMINVSAKVQNKLMAKFSSTKADYIQSKFHVNMFLFHYLVPWVHLIKNHKTLKSYKKASFIILLPASPP